MWRPKFFRRSKEDEIPVVRDVVQAPPSVKTGLAQPEEESKTTLLTQKNFEETHGNFDQGSYGAAEKIRYGNKASLNVKGFLKGAFAGAAMMGTAKIAFSMGARAIDTTGIGAATVTGVFSAGKIAREDYIKMRLLNSSYSRGQALRAIWNENKGVYAKTFGSGFASGFAGALGIDLVTEHWDAIKEFTQPVRDFTAPVAEKISGFAKPFTGWLTNALKPARYAVDGMFGIHPKEPLPQDTAPVDVEPQAGEAEAPQVIDTPEPAAENSPEVASEPTADPAQDSSLADAAPAEEAAEDAAFDAALPAAERLAALAENAALSEETREKIGFALRGHSWAVNEVIDGLLNQRFGFEAIEMPELAARLAEHFAALGDEGAQIKLAYLQYHSEFADLGLSAQDLGIRHDPEAALETINRLGRSWFGGEALLQSFSAAAEGAGEVALACDVSAAGIMTCAETGADVKPGNIIETKLPNGDVCRLKMGEAILDTPLGDYLGPVVRVHCPLPEFTAAR